MSLDASLPYFSNPRTLRKPACVKIHGFPGSDRCFGVRASHRIGEFVLGRAYHLQLGARLAGAKATLVVVDGLSPCNLELFWQVTATDDDHAGIIQFTGTCLSTTPGTPLTWCAFGVSPTGGMFPAGVFMLQAANGSVVRIGRVL